MKKLFCILMLVGAVTAAVGCAQNQKPDFDQTEAQRTENVQDTATLGGDTSYVVILNDPASKTAQELLGAMASAQVGGDGQVQAIIDRLASTGDMNELGNGKAGHIQGGVTVTVTMGSGTTPTVTGTATGSQAATGTQTSDAKQEPKSEVSASIPVAVGPQPNATSNFADRGSTATQEVSASQELRQALLRAQDELGADGLRELLADLFSGDTEESENDDAADNNSDEQTDTEE